MPRSDRSIPLRFARAGVRSACIVLLALCAGATAAFGQSSGGPYSLGASAPVPGGASAGGSFALTGAIGPPHGGLASGGGYAVSAGLIGEAALPPAGNHIFDNGFE